jgi:hypothetical protein
MASDDYEGRSVDMCSLTVLISRLSSTRAMCQSRLSDQRRWAPIKPPVECGLFRPKVRGKSRMRQHVVDSEFHDMCRADFNVARKIDL